MAEPTSLWLELQEYFEPIAVFRDRRWKLARCKHCGWERSANSFRMQEHLKKKHARLCAHGDGNERTDLSPEEPQHKKFKQSKIFKYTDVRFSAAQQERAELAMAFAQVQLSMPLNWSESPCFVRFVKPLFQPLSRFLYFGQIPEQTQK